jgi:eukaryotic-like serine/threonine-protein kinase
MTFQTGQTIGDYTVLGLAANRRTTEIYRVEHTITRRLEAMKTLRAEFENNPELAQRFMREIQLQASLNHPNIASVHNAFWVNDDLVLVMEHVEGEPLDQVLRNGPVPLRFAVEIVCQTLSALNHAHLHGVVHGAVNASNILITPEDKVKLTEFGLAKTPHDLALTPYDPVRPGVQYSAPEQVKKVAAVDPRSDIYSVGVVLYELVTGKRPFDSEESAQLVEAHTSQAPAPPQVLNPDVPVELSEAILTALTKDPDRRFQSAEAFRLAIEKQVFLLPEGSRAARKARRSRSGGGLASLLRSRPFRFSAVGILAGGVCAGMILLRGSAWFAAPAAADTLTAPVTARPPSPPAAVEQVKPAEVVAAPPAGPTVEKPPADPAPEASAKRPATARHTATVRRRKVDSHPVVTGATVDDEGPPAAEPQRETPAAPQQATSPAAALRTAPKPAMASPLLPAARAQVQAKPGKAPEVDGPKPHSSVRRFFEKILHPRKKQGEQEQ